MQMDVIQTYLRKVETPILMAKAVALAEATIMMNSESSKTTADTGFI